MTLWSWLFVLVAIGGWIVGGIWFQRWAKLHIAEADENTRREFKRRRARLTGITSLIAGGMFVVAMAITWPSVPAGNEPFVAAFLLFGAAFLVYGSYRLLRSRNMNKRRRVIGTSNSCIENAEKQLGFVLPPSFRAWLLENNGMPLHAVSIFPVFDPRDPRTTADSIVREYAGNWQSWCNTTGAADEFAFLLPFGEFGTGDYYCFDYRSTDASGEVPVVLWDHETGECEYRAPDFATFVEKVVNGEFPEA